MKKVTGFINYKNAVLTVINVLCVTVVVVFLFTQFPKPATTVGGFCDGVDPAAVCPPSGIGYICGCAPDLGSGETCSMGCLIIPDPPTCEGLGMTGGPWPFCTSSCPTVGQSCEAGPNSCSMMGSGVIVDNAGSCECNATVPDESLCAPPPPDPTCQDLGFDAGTPPAGCYMYDCTSNPTMDGCSCEKSNACNTTYGAYVGGSCNAAEPADCTGCVPNYDSAATTCTTDTFDDGCGNNVNGSLDCSGGGGGGGGGGGCTPDTSCANTTCTTDTCMATAADCSTYAIPGVSAAACISPTPPSTIEIDIAPERVRAGERVNVSWTVTSLTTLDCVVYGPNFGPIRFDPRPGSPTAGEASVVNRSSNPINAKSEFTVSCKDPSGAVYTRSAQVEVEGTVEER